MTVKKYRSVPVTIEAVKFDGSSSRKARIEHWMATGNYINDNLKTNDMTTMIIDTFEGPMTAKPGDYIIKGLVGEFYPCKPQVFEQKYELDLSDRPVG